ncbi:MAG TPA: WecB/TagA/CpsF family glycosyltransferase [Ktedonobacterales bacterium]|nr:WecB/TagA/CpsF family glycosyltransferase [Ktedonobacterales bacterium]
MSVRASLLGLSVDEMSQTEAVETICGIWRRGAKSRVFFVNAHCVNSAFAHPEYTQSLSQAEFVLPDGSGVLLASKILRLPIRHNLNGTDLTPLICQVAAEDGRSVFLLGAQPGVADQAAKTLVERFPTLRIAGVQHGFFAPEDSAEIVARINAAQPDVLLVALGVPTQEIWITEHFADLSVPVCLAVGALFDFLSNNVPRAPKLFRRLGIEWLFRLVREPRRLWRRYLIGNTMFMSRVFAARMGLTVAPVQRPGAVRVPDSGILAARPRAAAVSEAPYLETPVPSRGNMRWSPDPELRPALSRPMGQPLPQPVLELAPMLVIERESVQVVQR